MEWMTAVTTLAASFGGFLLAGVNESRRDGRALEREQIAEARGAASRTAEQRHKFQLDTLLELQDQIQKMTRLNGRTMLFDHAQARAGQLTQLPDGLSEELFENQVAVKRLTERVLEEEVRAAVKQFMESCSRFNIPAELMGHEGDEPAIEAIARDQVRELSTAVETVMNALGEHIRRALTWEDVRLAPGV